MERKHQSNSTMRAIKFRENLPIKYEDFASLVHKKCMTAQYAIRTTVHSTLYPWQNCLWTRYVTSFSNQINWSQLIQRKQAIVNQNNTMGNIARKNFYKKVGDELLLLNKN